MCTLNEAWNAYLSTKEFSPTSIKKDIQRFNKHVFPYWKNKDMNKLKYYDIVLYRQYLSSLGLSPQSVKHCLGLLRRTLNRASHLELYTGTLPHFEMPIVKNERVRFLSKEEANMLFEALKKRNEMWHDISLLALHTGMRASEIFSLTSANIHFEHNSISLFDTKNFENRTIPLNEISNGILEKYIKKYLPYFFSESPIKQVSRIFSDTVKEVRLNKHIKDRRDKFVFHSLRHTYASWLVQNGVSLPVVSQLLGHKSLQMTMRYAHLAPQQGQHAVSILSNIMCT